MTILKLLVPISCLMFLTVLEITNATNSEIKHRAKRKVVFSKSSKFFFRLNGKDSILNNTEIFAHGWGFRINYNLPDTIPKRHQFFKRDVHVELDSIINESELNLYSCILKYICENVRAVKSSKNCGFFCGIGSIIASTLTMESDFFKSFLNKCDFHINNCPYFWTTSNLDNL